MSTSVNILHLTDLHLLSPLAPNQTVLLDALKKDLCGLRATDLCPDIAVFTGDLSAHAETVQFEKALDLLLDLVDCVGLDERKLVLCPGNHDAHRGPISSQIDTLRTLRTAAATRDGANEMFQSPAFAKYVSAVFGNFRNLSDEFCRDAVIYSDSVATTYFLRSISIVAINTASLTSAGINGEPEDRGMLAVPETSILKAIEAAPAGVPIAVVGHHPLEWLNDENATLMRRLLPTSRAALYLCGHLHEPMPNATHTANGNLFVGQSGALYGHRDYWNGYSIISAESAHNHLRGTFRRWFEPRRAFSHAEDLADGGVFFSDDAARKYWIATPKKINCSHLEDWRATVLVPSVLAECNISLSGQTLEELFVTPEFERDIPVRRETDERIGSKTEVHSFDFLVEDSQNYVISARKESGKSTLLKQWALRLARSSTSKQGWSAPVFLTASTFKVQPNRVVSAINQKLPELPFGFTTKGLLEQGLVTILVDEVDFKIARHRDNLLKFIAQFPRCRYILATATPFVESSTLLPEISPDVPFIVVRLKAFRQSQLLTLIENHGVKDPLRADQLLQRVVRDASALNLPLTAVTSTFLIQIFSENSEELPVHQAALIERYLELLLQKFAPRDLLPATFNFKNKIDLLSVIALRMTEAQDYEPEENVVVGWVVTYLADYGLKYSATDLFSYFVDSRVLERSSGRVRFRLRMFYEFFVATRMREDEQFREFIFSDENYLLYANEVSFYAALSLRDRARLEQVFQAFEALDEKYSERFTNAVQSGGYLESFLEPDETVSAEELGELEKQVRSEAERKANRDELLESADVVDSADQTVARASLRTPEERWLAHLIVVSAMLKHTELIPDQEKRRYLERILDGWIKFAATSLGIIGKLAIERKVILNGVTYRLNLSDDLPPGEIARRLALGMPIAVAKMAAIFVGTEKLQLQLEDKIGDADEPPSRQFFRFAVLSELMVDNIVEMASKLTDRLRDHRYLKHVLARKLYDLAVRYRLREEQLIGVRSIVADIFVSLGGTKTKKSKLIENMSRERLLIEMKRDGEK